MYSMDLMCRHGILTSQSSQVNRLLFRSPLSRRVNSTWNAILSAAPGMTICREQSSLNNESGDISLFTSGHNLGIVPDWTSGGSYCRFHRRLLVHISQSGTQDHF